MEFYIRDKWGYPVEIYKGKHIHNFFRKLFLCNIIQTIKHLYMFDHAADVGEKIKGKKKKENANDKLQKWLNHSGETTEKVERFADNDKMGWIPVSERLPKNSGNYLCSSKKWASNNTCKEWIEVQYYDKRLDSFVTSYVVAWCPLPEPYKEGK